MVRFDLSAYYQPDLSRHRQNAHKCIFIAYKNNNIAKVHLYTVCTWLSQAKCII